MKKLEIKRAARHAGFSLFELLMVVMLLSFLVMMALPSFGSTDPARQSVHKQNAQNFCSLAAALDAAGVNVTSGTNDVPTVLRRLVSGVTVTHGALKNKIFKLPNINESHILGSAIYIKIKNGCLQYDGSIAP
jgi:prepilin-type N-terminal cleavage/methylation domain-containing protein